MYLLEYSGKNGGSADVQIIESVGLLGNIIFKINVTDQNIKRFTKKINAIILKILGDEKLNFQRIVYIIYSRKIFTNENL